jgi:hypothetical protein
MPSKPRWRRLAALVAVITFACVMPMPAAPSGDEAELTRLLREFLAGASRNDATAHQRFWADDLVYTGSSGRRIGKADILRDLGAPASPEPAGPPTTYTAKRSASSGTGDRHRCFPSRGHHRSGSRTEVARYLASGTFLKRGGEWRAVAGGRQGSAARTGRGGDRGRPGGVDRAI